MLIAVRNTGMRPKRSAPKSSRGPSRTKGGNTNTVGTIVVGVMLAAILALGFVGYQSWTGQKRAAEVDAWKKSNALRAALRYGELMLPADGGNVCRAYAFDNSTGMIGDERDVPCQNEPDVDAMAAGDGGRRANGPAARMQAMSQAFKH
jgi:hypothetical protein